MHQTRLIPSDSPLHRLRRLPKFAKSKLCILLVENGYHLQKECKASLTRMGHKVVSLVIGEDGDAQSISAIIDNFLRAVITHRPDMMLSIDCLGFDRNEQMGEVVDAVGLPTAVWYVDSPMFIALGFLNPAPDLTSVFSWDQSYLPILRDLGCQRVAHLPLATDLSTFYPRQTSHAGCAYPISFVGNTLHDLERRWHSRLAPGAHALAEQYRCAILADRQALITLSKEAKAPLDPNMATLAYANFCASKSYRHGLLRGLPQSLLHVFGDKAWRMLLPRASTYDGFAYGDKLAEVFCQSTVNFNATNLQMPCTVNQRVFDVPACGALLLTDNQSELAHYFEPGREVLAYNSPEEAVSFATFYSQHPNAGRDIVARARARVRAEHTYDHRLKVLVDTMRHQHQRGFAHAPRRLAPTPAPIATQEA